MRTHTEVVYSTDPDWCSKCRQAPCACAVKPASAPLKKGHTIKMRLEKSGRGGKVVTVLFELGMAPEQQKDLMRNLQKKCGTGGTWKDGRIELQGDRRNLIESELQSRNIKVKRAGG